MGDGSDIIILIYGLGSIGLMLATALATATKCRLILITRAATAKIIERDGIHRTGVLGNCSIRPDRFEVFASLSEVPNVNINHVICAVKCYQMTEVAEAIAQRKDLFRATAYHCFQNGIQGSDPLLSVTDPNTIYLARIITGANRTQPNRTAVTVHQADLMLGSRFGDAPIAPAEQLAGYLRAGGVPTSTTHRIQQILWEKALYNIAVNGLSALYNRSIGELADDFETRSLIESLLEEGYYAMASLGEETSFASFEAYRCKFWNTLIPATRQHFSSMHADLQRAKPRTEIDFLNGAVTRIARASGWIAGANAWVTARIRARETAMKAVDTSTPHALVPGRAAPEIVGSVSEAEGMSNERLVSQAQGLETTLVALNEAA